ALAAAPRVVVVPTARMEDVSCKGIDTRQTRELGQALPTNCENEMVGCKRVVAVGLDVPAFLVSGPLCPGDRGVKARLVVEAVLLADPLAEFEHFIGIRVAVFRGVVQLFEQREVN